MHRSSLLAAALALCACAPIAPRGAPTPAREARIPMDVRLYEPQPMVFPFTLSRPGYVAIFEVVPDAGVGLVYPARFAVNEPFSAGAWWATAFNPVARWGYQNVSYFRSARPTFYYAIASTRPLRLEPLLTSPMAMRRLLGYQRFAAATPSSQLLSLLAGQVLPPDIQDDEWAADVFVRWPEPTRLFRPLPETAWMRCPDGHVVALTTLATGSTACAELHSRLDSARAPVPADSGARPAPSDSARPFPRPNPQGSDSAPATRAPRRLRAVLTADRPVDGRFGLHPAIGDPTLPFESEERLGGARPRTPQAWPSDRGGRNAGAAEPAGPGRMHDIGRPARDRTQRPVNGPAERPARRRPVERPAERPADRSGSRRPAPAANRTPVRPSSPSPSGSSRSSAPRAQSTP